MNQSPPDRYRHKKIKGVFIIALAIAVTLGFNAFILSQERTSGTTRVAAPNTDHETEQTFTLDEVAVNASAEQCWMVVAGEVYDITDYVASGRHPGGQSELLSGCGTDATDIFKRIHSSRAESMLTEFKIGILE